MGIEQQCGEVRLERLEHGHSGGLGLPKGESDRVMKGSVAGVWERAGRSSPSEEREVPSPAVPCDDRASGPDRLSPGAAVLLQDSSGLGKGLMPDQLPQAAHCGGGFDSTVIWLNPLVQVSDKAFVVRAKADIHWQSLFNLIDTDHSGALDWEEIWKDAESQYSHL